MTRKRKSEALTEAEHAALKQYRTGYNTEVECALSIGIDRVVLNRVLAVGSGSPETIKKVRQVLGPVLTKEG
jgi:uncharacterized protein YnzC (UPF0291/DUF896 family)